MCHTWVVSVIVVVMLLGMMFPSLHRAMAQGEIVQGHDMSEHGMGCETGPCDEEIVPSCISHCVSQSPTSVPERVVSGAFLLEQLLLLPARFGDLDVGDFLVYFSLGPPSFEGIVSLLDTSILFSVQRE